MGAFTAGTSSSAFLGIRVYFVIVFAICFILSAAGLYAAHKKRSTHENVMVRNIKKFTLSFISLYFLIELLFWAIDPFSVHGVLPLDISVWCSPPLPIMLIVFGAVLFHWAEFYHVSMKTLREKEMLRKVNKAYQGEVTLEEMITKVGTIKRFQIPFAIIATVGFVLRVLHSVLTFRHTRSSKIIVGFDLGFFGVCWMLLTIAYLVYGRRLVSLMPPEFSSKVKKFTRKIAIVSMLNCFFFCGVIALCAAFYEGHFTSDSLLIMMMFLLHQLPMIVMVLLLALYMKLDWRLSHCIGLVSSSGGSSSTKTAPSTVEDIGLSYL